MNDEAKAQGQKVIYPRSQNLLVTTFWEVGYDNILIAWHCLKAHKEMSESS